MGNKKVVLVRKCKTETGWRRYPVLIGKNGRVRPDYVVVGSEHKVYPNGHYELRTYDGSKAIHRNVGNDPAEALAARNKAQLTLQARHTAHAADTKIIEKPGRVLLQTAVENFIQRTRDRQSFVAAEAYRVALADFLRLGRIVYADEVTEAVILAFHKGLRHQGNSQRTVHNKHTAVKGFLRSIGVDVKAMGIKSPKYSKAMPGIYSDTELRQFFAGLEDGYHRAVFNTLLRTGLRMQEAMHLVWSDLDFEGKRVRVTSKPSEGFTIKDYEEREVPLAEDLANLLKEWRSERPGTRYVLGTRNDTPNDKWLQLLKRLARRGGLNCNNCESCRTRNECAKWFLHKFRATYCTRLLRSGIDPRTVMAFMGHSDMATTLRYLSPAGVSETQARVNSISWW
jgi:integrase